MKKVIKQFISTVLGVAITSSTVPFTSVQAEETITEKYPYTLFAGSSDEGAININSNNVCINGNIATNGTITTTAGNFNINGIKAENVDEPIIYFFNKLDTAYFDTSATATYSEDYFCEETNININTPIEAEGDITLKGNINISSGLKALNDVNLSGNVENTQHSAISSQTGDIIINTDNVNLNGIVYAPYGCVNISAMNLNMNSVIIIADKINISCPNFNANYNIQMGEFIGLESEETEYDTELNDSDKDGLPDIFETKLGTDIEDSDTDGDELTDYEEFFITGTDPTIYDSVHEGISDSDADCDEDGLCNIDEIARGTDPRDSDTDLDGLTDYDEIFIYNTDPLVADSDNDSIDDGSEVKLGLDPNNALTYGIPDGEYKISQVITAENGILSAFNTEESPYTLSIEMKTNRDIEKEISVSNSGYSNVISNDAMIGASLDISLSDNCDPEDIVLRYDIKERATENTLDKYSSLSELQGIRRLNVFKFDEEERMLIPVETKFSDDNKQLYAEVDELGTYCIMDMEIWLNELGVEMPESVDPAISLNQMSNIKIMAAAPKNTEPLYLLFMLQTNYIPVETAASYEQKLNSEINTIKSLSKYAFDKYKALDVQVQVLTYTDITASPMLNSKGENYFTDYNELCSNLDTIQYRATLSEANRKNAYMMAEIKCEVLKHPNTFACLFINSYTYFSPGINTLGLPYDDAYYWVRWQSVNTFCSLVYLNKEDFKYDFSAYFNIEENYENAQDEQKKFAPIETALDTSNDSNYKALRDYLIKHVEHLYGVTAPKEDNSFDIIVPTRWKKITLKGTLSPDNGIDTDGDTLTDWEEVDTTKIKINTDNSIELPTFTIAAMVEHLSRFNSAEYNFLTRDNAPRLYLPIISDPTMKDSDGDDIPDNEDLEPLKIFLHELLQKLELMEKYIDDYKKYLINSDYNNYDNAMQDIITEIINTETSIISINIIRNLYYGWEGNTANGVKWTVTDGTDFPLVKNYICEKDSSILEYFRMYNGRKYKSPELKLFKDKTDQEIDLLHMLATLGGQGHDEISLFLLFGKKDTIEPPLSGWAGDLQSAIQDLRIFANSTEYEPRLIEDSFYKLIVGEISINTPLKLTLQDLLADIDAQNIHNTYSQKETLSYMIKNYYTYHTDTRFTDFVDSFGGINEFSDLVYSYTRGNDPVKHLILHFFALRNGDIFVTTDESNILWKVFMRVIKEKINEESN